MVGRAVYDLIKKDKNLKIIDCPRRKLRFYKYKKIEKWFKK